MQYDSSKRPLIYKLTVLSPWQHAGFQTSPILEAFLKVSTVTLVFHFFSAWLVFKRSQHENYLSTNILKTHLCRLQHTMNFFLLLADKCKHCGKFFNQLTDCTEQKSHTGMKSYTCQYCAKSLSKLSYCKEHERTHIGEKPYTCKHCKKSFSCSSHCKRHERIHTGEKRYTCRHCKKSFSYSSACKVHERTHTGEKPYKCKHCEKSFNQLSNCKRHERAHTREKPYTCKHCEKSFTQFSSCKRHEKRHTRPCSLKQEQHDQCLKSRRDLQESAATLGGRKSCALSSLTEENSGQVESLTCWICQKEFSSEACVTQHYDEHMRLK